jgi:hypothetical protein
MPASPGTRFGPYEIVAPLGAGGMGEVYKPTDTRLDRTVAIKLLRKAHTDRFEREARAIAALNHPHIFTLYDVGPDYLVMEYVEDDIALIYTGLGEKDLAFAWLEKAYVERTGRLLELPDPAFDSLRSDPRFLNLVKRIGLPQ